MILGFPNEPWPIVEEEKKKDRRKTKRKKKEKLLISFECLLNAVWKIFSPFAD